MCRGSVMLELEGGLCQGRGPALLELDMQLDLSLAPFTHPKGPTPPSQAGPSETQQGAQPASL
jgi:hypothetical protein